MREDYKTLIYEQLGHLFEPELLAQMVARGHVQRFRKDDIVIDIGMVIDSMPLLLSGALKVLREDNEYRELLLYYLESGETCTMSMSCCMERKKSTVRAIAEEESVLAFLPTELINDWMAKFPLWRNYIFNSFQMRVDELLGAVDMLAFLKMDERIMRYLVKLSEIQSSQTVKTTHRQIAEDLNTSRVVVSRVVKDLEKKGRLQINRSSIVLLE